MSRATRQRDAVAPSLFPFLAVLLCTMGALVLILMLVVSGAQASARQVALESEQQAEEVESQLAAARRGFEKQLAERRIELEKKRLALQHLENHIQEIMAELDKLERTSQLADEQASSDEAARAARAAEISALEKQLLEAQEQLKQKLDKPDGDKPIFAIIPYDGPNGTHRRPIYVECVEEGIRLQPEGVLIRLKDLEPPYGPGNPLDAALRTIRAHYVPANHAVTSTAYPLLVVRPSGIRSYAMARAALSGWDDQFGYELVGEELELVYPDGEPGLADKIAQALDLARARQAALILAMPQKYREFAGREGPLPGGPGAGAGSGGGSSTAGYGGGAATGGDYAGGNSSAAAAGRGGWANGSPGANGPQLSADGPAGATAAGPVGFGNNSAASLDFEAARAQAGGRESLIGSDLTDLLSGGAGDGRGTGSSGGDPAGSTSGDGDASGPAGAQPSTSANSTASNSAGSNSTGENSAGGQSGATGDAGQLPGNQVALPLAAPGGAMPAGGQSPSGSQSATGAQNATSAQTAASNWDGSSDAQGNPQLSMEQQFGAGQSPDETTTAVAQRKGRGWAWSQGPPTQTAVVRSIRMICYADRWVVLPDSSRTAASAVTISCEEPPQQRAEKLARVVAQRVDEWGLALSGGYWKPVLTVEVAPDAEGRFQQLQQLLAGSGLELQRTSPAQP